MVAIKRPALPHIWRIIISSYTSSFASKVLNVVRNSRTVELFTAVDLQNESGWYDVGQD